MPKPRITARQRAAVVARACAYCEYCRSQEQFAPDPFSVEHIIPVTKGGTNALTNLAFSCQTPMPAGTTADENEDRRLTQRVPRSRFSVLFSREGCNGRKYVSTAAIDAATGTIVALYHPRQHRWDDHFAWNPDCSLIIGLTPTGRATVDKLQLNRVGLVNLRRVLYLVGAHPPEC